MILNSRMFSVWWQVLPAGIRPAEKLHCSSQKTLVTHSAAKFTCWKRNLYCSLPARLGTAEHMQNTLAKPNSPGDTLGASYLLEAELVLQLPARLPHPVLGSQHEAVLGWHSLVGRLSRCAALQSHLQHA